MNEKAFKEINPSTEDYSCSCCDFFWPGWAEQQLRLHRDKPNLLYRDLREIIEEGFARYGWSLLNRLIDLEGFSECAKKASEILAGQTKNKPPRPMALPLSESGPPLLIKTEPLGGL